MNPVVDKSGQMRLQTGRRIASRIAGLLHLGSGLASEIVDVVERMHGTIERRPLPLGKLESDRPTAITGAVYRGIRDSFEVINNAVGRLAQQLSHMAGEDDSPAWAAVRAAINGVCGDSLEERGNPLAQPMRFVRHSGDFEGKTLVLFLHGLCMTENGWQRGEFAEFETWCRAEAGARTVHLRYNTGRRVSVNGRELAGKLENLVEEEGIERLILICHSMGGLVIRSACHYAQGLVWPQKVTHIAMLGTPHHGAPLERIGNLANGILKISPYSTPLAHIGDLRSAGIKDLRFANLIDEDWLGTPHDATRPPAKAVLPLLGHADYLLIAATRSEQVAEALWRCKDDLLVTVPSALGLSRDENKHLEHDRLRREVVANTDHITLMGDSHAMAHLRDWLISTV